MTIQYDVHKKGMTLVELVVVLSLFTILSYVLLNGIASFYRYNAYTISQAYQVSQARRGVELSVRDMREMTYADDGAFPLVAMSENSISFYSDIDRDNSVELVSYTLSSTTLRKHIYDSVGSPPVYSTSTPDQTFIISEYVRNAEQATILFTYYDGDGNPVTSSDVTSVRYIDVQVIVNIDPIRDSGLFMLRSSASLRNLKDS